MTRVKHPTTRRPTRPVASPAKEPAPPSPIASLVELVEGLPARVESAEVVRKTQSFFHEQEHAATAWAHARQHDVAERLEEITSALNQRTVELRAKVQGNLATPALRDQATRMLDDALLSVGLMRCTLHEEILAEALRNLRKRTRLAARKEVVPRRRAAAEHVQTNSDVV